MGAEPVRESLALDVAVDGDAHVADPALRALLYHLVRELVFNVAKHAGTDRARIAVGEADGVVTVRVEDEGAGFDISALARGEGFGLASVRERLEAVGGRLDVATAPGVGTRVSMVVPVRDPEAVGSSADGSVAEARGAGSSGPSSPPVPGSSPRTCRS